MCASQTTALLSSHLPDIKFRFSTPPRKNILGRFLASGPSTLAAISSLFVDTHVSELFFIVARGLHSEEVSFIIISARQTKLAGDAHKDHISNEHLLWNTASAMSTLYEVLKTSPELKYVRKEKLARTQIIFFPTQCQKRLLS